MITLFQKYDHWAKQARLVGFDEWPEPASKDIWTGKEGKQYGVWDGEVQQGVLCSTPEEFVAWLEEGDLPPAFKHEMLICDGDIRIFSKEPL